MCTVLLPPGDNPTAVNKCIISYHIWKRLKVSAHAAQVGAALWPECSVRSVLLQSVLKLPDSATTRPNKDRLLRRVHWRMWTSLLAGMMRVGLWSYQSTSPINRKEIRQFATSTLRSVSLRCRLQLKCDNTRWPTGEEVKGKLAIGVGSQYSHTTSEHCVSSITTAEAHTSATSSRLNWRPHRFKWTRPFRRKTKSGFWACVITFQKQSTTVFAQSTCS